MIIVARDRPDLQAYFEQAFAGIPDVQVIRDRRLGDAEPTRRPASPPPSERRDRYAMLQNQAFILVRIR